MEHFQHLSGAQLGLEKKKIRFAKRHIVSNTPYWTIELSADSEELMAKALLWEFTCLLVSETRLDRKTVSLSLGISIQKTKLVLCPVVDSTPVLVSIWKTR